MSKTLIAEINQIFKGELYYCDDPNYFSFKDFLFYDFIEWLPKYHFRIKNNKIIFECYRGGKACLFEAIKELNVDLQQKILMNLDLFI